MKPKPTSSKPKTPGTNNERLSLDRRDLSLLTKSLDMSLPSIKKLLKAYASGLPDAVNILEKECSIIIECRVCKNLYRCIANFLIHKRAYCTKSINESHPDHEHAATMHYTEHKKGKKLTSLSSTRKNVLNALNAVKDIVENRPDKKAFYAVEMPEITSQALFNIRFDPEDQLNGKTEVVEPTEVVTQSEVAMSSVSTTSKHKCNLCGKQCRTERTLLLHLGNAHALIRVKSDEETEESVPTFVESVRVAEQAILVDSTKLVEPTKVVGQTEVIMPSELVMPPEVIKPPEAVIPSEATTSKSKCNLCGTEYVSERSHFLHVKNAHPGLRLAFICPLCKNYFCSTSSIQRHLNKVHKLNKEECQKIKPNIQKKLVTKEEYDKKCIKIIKAPKVVRDDRKGEKDEINVMPSLVVMSSEDVMPSEVMPTVSSTSKHKCSPCDLQCTTERALLLHLRKTHAGLRLAFICPYCEKEFATSWTVYRHMCNVHTNYIEEIQKSKPDIEKTWIAEEDAATATLVLGEMAYKEDVDDHHSFYRLASHENEDDDDAMMTETSGSISREELSYLNGSQIDLSNAFSVDLFQNESAKPKKDIIPANTVPEFNISSYVNLFKSDVDIGQVANEELLDKLLYEFLVQETKHDSENEDEE